MLVDMGPGPFLQPVLSFKYDTVSPYHPNSSSCKTVDPVKLQSVSVGHVVMHTEVLILRFQ